MRQLLLITVLVALPAAAQTRPAFADVNYAGTQNPRQTFDLFLPPGAGPFPLVVWIHGGAWVGGSKAGAGGLAPRLLQRGIAVASINYRLSGEAVFPAQIQDCRAAIRHLRANAAQYRIMPDRIGVAGSSAGGHLVALAGTAGGETRWDTPDMPNAGQSSRVQAVAVLFGPMDFLQMDAMLPPGCPDGSAIHSQPGSPEARLLGCTIASCPEKVREASPLTYIGPDDPPFLILHGSNDCTVPAGQGRLLAEALTAPYIYRVLPGAGHGGPQFSAAGVTRLIDDFFERVLKGGSLATVSAADYQFANVAPGMFISVFHPAIAAAGTHSVTVQGSAARVVGVADGQINALLPRPLASGAAELVLLRDGQKVYREGVRAVPSTPSLFGTGEAVWVDAAGVQRRQALDLPLPYENGPVTVVLYGTGLANSSEAIAYLDDQEVPVRYAGPQPRIAGLDQYNVELPAAFQGRGVLTLAISVGGTPVTPVRLTN